MATAIAGLQATSSRTTASEAGIDNANTWRVYYTIPGGREIHVTHPDATAVVMQPFFVEVKLMGDEYLATGHISNSFEFGATPGRAMKNYLELLVDNLTWLEKHEAELSPSVHEDLRLLQSYLQIV